MSKDSELLASNRSFVKSRCDRGSLGGLDMRPDNGAGHIQVGSSLVLVQSATVAALFTDPSFRTSAVLVSENWRHDDRCCSHDGECQGADSGGHIPRRRSCHRPSLRACVVSDDSSPHRRHPNSLARGSPAPAAPKGSC